MNLGVALKKLKGKSWIEIFERFISIMRGFFISIRLKTEKLIFVRGSMKIIRKNGNISIGEYTEFWPGVKLSCVGLSKRKPAEIVIGKRCSVGDRTEIHSGRKVEIGDDVIIAWDCVILDRDYHSASGKNEIIKPVQIKNGAWIGCRSIILKGVTIGEGGVVGAGSVVNKNVEPYTLVAGNPAMIIKKVDGWKS